MKEELGKMHPSSLAIFGFWEDSFFYVPDVPDHATIEEHTYKNMWATEVALDVREWIWEELTEGGWIWSYHVTCNSQRTDKNIIKKKIAISNESKDAVHSVR